MDDTQHVYEEQVIKGVDYKAKNLQRYSFNHVVFEGCDFTQCDLRLAQFSHCKFKSCNLSLANMSGCRLDQVVFEESKLVGVDFYKCEKMFLSLGFKACIMQSCNFSDLKLKSTIFKGSKITDSHFSKNDLSLADFSDSDLLGTNFHQCNLTKANFLGAKNYIIDLDTNVLKKARFAFPEVLNLLKCFDIDISM